MGEHQGEEKYSPRRPNDTNGHDEGKEHCNQLPLLHAGRERVARGDEGEMEGGGLGFFSQRGGGQPVLGALQILPRQQQRFLEVMPLPVDRPSEELSVITSVAQVIVQGLEKQLHGSVEVVAVRAEKDPVEGRQLFANFSVVDIPTHHRNYALAVFHCVVHLPVAYL